MSPIVHPRMVLLGAFAMLLGVQLTRFEGLARTALEGYDDMFQLALGLKVAHGEWAGLDFFTNYGPGVAVLSAASWMWGNPILAEVVVGTLLLSAGSWAFWRAGFVRGKPAHNVFLIVTLAVFAAGWVKYYYVLWPGLLLLLLGDPAEAMPARQLRFRWLLLGVVAGLGGWFRPEIGLALMAVLAGGWFLRWRSPAGDRASVRLMFFAIIGASLPWLFYFACAWVARGRFGGPRDLIDFYFSSTLAKAVDFHWVTLAPRIAGFFRPYTQIAWFTIGVAVASVAVMVWFFPRGGRGSPLSRRAWCAAWMLICLSPPAIHRFDLTHVQQMMAPGLVALSLGFAALQEQSEASRHRIAGVLRWAAPVALALLVIVVGRIHVKTAPPLSGTVSRVRSLVDGLGALDQDAPDLRLAEAARAQLGPGDTILVPSIDTRLIVLVGRPFGGVLPHWSFRLPRRWQERHLAALQAKPAALVLRADYFQLPEEAEFLRPLDFRGRNPVLEAHIEAAYPRVVFQTRRWSILAPIAVP